MSDLPPKGTPSLVIIISDSLIVASRILRLAVSFYSKVLLHSAHFAIWIGNNRSYDRAADSNIASLILKRDESMDVLVKTTTTQRLCIIQ